MDRTVTLFCIDYRHFLSKSPDSVAISVRFFLTGRVVLPAKTFFYALDPSLGAGFILRMLKQKEEIYVHHWKNVTGMPCQLKNAAPL